MGARLSLMDTYPKTLAEGLPQASRNQGWIGLGLESVDEVEGDPRVHEIVFFVGEGDFVGGTEIDVVIEAEPEA